MKIGYARVSSTDQHLDRQIEKLKAEGCEKIFEDKFSGASKERPALRQLMSFIREGDVVLITELDRLGRNSADLTEIMNEIQRKKATLDVLNLPSLRGIEDENLRRLLNNIIIELYKYQAERSFFPKIIPASSLPLICTGTAKRQEKHSRIFLLLQASAAALWTVI